jgi:hypothetical protein
MDEQDTQDLEAVRNSFYVRTSNYSLQVIPYLFAYHFFVVGFPSSMAEK